MKKQQTAVEWLKEVYESQGRILPEQFNQALDMEKGQIEYAHVHGQHWVGSVAMQFLRPELFVKQGNEKNKIDVAQDFYKNTYGK